MLNYMSDELFTKYFDGLGFKEIEGELAVSDVGEETNTYNVTSLEFVENQGDKKVYNISFTNNETGETENAKIVVVEKDNNYIVANYEKE